MKESKQPKYDLSKIKRAFDKAEKLNMTYSAMQGQYELGLSDQEVVEAIQDITINDFYKSMAPHHEKFAAWQDVYKSNYKNINLYIKFQINKNKELIISFKKR